MTYKRMTAADRSTSTVGVRKEMGRERLLDDWGDQPVAGQTGTLRSNTMGRKETFQRIRPRMEAFAQGLTRAKGALYQILYLQTPVTSLAFHQDHDHFYLTEYNRTHLNYWIPLIKPSRTEAGLHLIPWDRLGEKSPRLYNLCRRSGASRLYSLRGGNPAPSSFPGLSSKPSLQ